MQLLRRTGSLVNLARFCVKYSLHSSAKSKKSEGREKSRPSTQTVEISLLAQSVATADCDSRAVRMCTARRQVVAIADVGLIEEAPVGEPCRDSRHRDRNPGVADEGAMLAAVLLRSWRRSRRLLVVVPPLAGGAASLLLPIAAYAACLPGLRSPGTAAARCQTPASPSRRCASRFLPVARTRR